MEKIIVGPACHGALDIDAPVKDNLKAIAQRLDRDVEDLVVMVLDRPRHEKLIADIREAGARIRLIGDGDLSAGIAAAVRGAGVHAVMGIGGAPEGVITAAAMRCLHGEMVGRLVVDNGPGSAHGTHGHHAIRTSVYRAEDLAPGKQIIFAACGVTPGSLLQGVRFFGDGYRTHSLVMTLNPNNVSFRDTVHMTSKPGRAASGCISPELVQFSLASHRWIASSCLLTSARSSASGVCFKYISRSDFAATNSRRCRRATPRAL